MNRVNLTNKKGYWFNIDSAKYFKEDTWIEGGAFISRATGSQFEHQGLYITESNRFILNSWSNYSGNPETYVEISKSDAIDWLIVNNHYSYLQDYYPQELSGREI